MLASWQNSLHTQHVFDTVILNFTISLNRIGSKNKLDKLLKGRKGTFPLLIKVGIHLFLRNGNDVYCSFFLASLTASVYYFKLWW